MAAGADDEMLSQPIGSRTPTPSQRLVIETMRRLHPFGGRGRRWASRILTRLRAGPVDYDLDGLTVRFRHAESSGDRKALFALARFDAPERSFLAERLPRGGTFVDIGANFGIYTLGLTAARPDLTIVAVEPMPHLARQLAATVAANGRQDRVAVVAAAAGAAVGEATIDTRLESMARGSGSLTVPVRPLVDILAEHGVARIDALKIDVEGYEDRVLFPFFEQAAEALWPRFVVMECVLGESWERDCIALLAGRGYREHWRGPLNSILERTPSSSSGPMTGNAQGFQASARA